MQWTLPGPDLRFFPAYTLTLYLASILAFYLASILTFFLSSVLALYLASILTVYLALWHELAWAHSIRSRMSKHLTTPYLLPDGMSETMSKCHVRVGTSRSKVIDFHVSSPDEAQAMERLSKLGAAPAAGPHRISRARSRSCGRVGEDDSDCQ